MAGRKRLLPRIAVAVLAAAVAVAWGSLSERASAVTLTGTVSQVVDGDTVKVVSRGFETPVRLIGIDTPETRAPGKPVQCFGPAATARAKRLLPVGRRVRLVTDPTQDRRDRYGRLLAYVYTPGRSGPTGSVNHALVASGHAKVYVYGGVRFRHATQFLRAQSRAKKARRGLWAPPCRGNTTKPDPKQPAPSAPTPAPTNPVPTTPTPSPGGGCDPNYTGACIPPAPPDLDCGEIPYRNFRSVGTDPHNFDVDHDGIACEE
ncbi:MAG: thermonuclease family protein [Thermoleophilia bacterium]